MRAIFLPRLHGLRPLLAISLLAACGEDASVDSAALTEEPAASSTAPGYRREFVFVGSRAGAPLVAPFAFRTESRRSGIERRARAWLAHGATWDPFLEESWRTPSTTGVWRVLPHGELRLTVGGSTELEAFWYERGERRLRLELQRPLSGWSQGGSTRYRLLDGELLLGPERLSGAVLEIMQVERGPPRDGDWLFLSSGDTLRLVVAEAMGSNPEEARSFALVLTPDGERTWERASVRWIELRPLEEARRDIPLRWSFAVPEGAIHGEVSALGFHHVVGAERGGRRAVEVRYTVEGWVELAGQRSIVTGTIRHVQE